MSADRAAEGGTAEEGAAEEGAADRSADRASGGTVHSHPPALLVLGGSGLLGTEVVVAARARGWSTCAPARAEVDITDQTAVRTVLERQRPTVVINAAAWTDVDACEAEPEHAHRINAAAVGALAEACIDRGIRLVQLSTDYVFGGAAPPWGADGRPRGWREDEPPAPVNVYGRTKLASEGLVHAAGGATHLVVRTAWLSGLGGGFVPAILQSARARQRAAPAGRRGSAERTGPADRRGSADLLGVVDRTGSPTVAHHLAVGVLDAVEREVAGTLHLAGSGAATWYDVARVVVEEAGLDVEVEPCSAAAFPRVAARPTWSVLDTSRARRLGVALPPWEAQVSELVRVLLRRS